LIERLSAFEAFHFPRIAGKKLVEDGLRKHLKAIVRE